MWYTLQVYTLVVFAVFGITSGFILAVTAFNAAKDYARVLRLVRRVASRVDHEPIVISRTVSRIRETNPHRAA